MENRPQQPTSSEVPGECKVLFTIRKAASMEHMTAFSIYNVIDEAAYKIQDVHQLTNIQAGTLISVTEIQGGTAPKEYPTLCSFTVDVKYVALVEYERVLIALRKIAQKVYVEGTHTTISLS